MRYWFDTEFIENGKTIELLSIGIVAEDGRSLYLESSECNTNGASPWVIENVFLHLTGGAALADRVQMQTAIRNFVDDGGGKPEFWAYYAAYDWVALCQLFGTMMDLPKGWPMYCRDVKQLCDDLGNPALPPQEGTEHHALADARWTREAWEFLQERREAA